MAHEIYQDGQGNFAFAWAAGGAVPWHKLGHAVPKGASRATWLKLAGYLWEIKQAPVQYEALVAGKSLLAQSSKHVVNYRSDTGAPLGVVTTGYKVVQPQEIFDALWSWAEAGGLTPETAGVLRGGQRFFVLAKHSGTVEIKKGDKTQSFCLLATSADGTIATRAQWTAVRVVCANTLAVATGKRKAEYKCSHRKVWDPNQAAAALGVKQAQKDWETFADQLTRLATKKVSDKDATAYFSDMLRPPRHDEGRVIDLSKTRKLEKVRAIRGLDDLETSYRHAPGAAPGTWYGVVQGLTHYVDHARGSSAGSRLDSALFAQGADLKRRGWNEALLRAGVN